MEFFLTYLLNTFFVVFLICSFFYLSINLVFFLENKKFLIKSNYNYLAVFFLFFAILSFVFNFLFYFDFLSKFILKFILYIFYLIFVLSVLFNSQKQKIFKEFVNFIFILKKKKYNILLIGIFFIISTFPMSDADSLVYFNLPTQLLSYGNILSDISYLENRLFSSAELILLLSFVTNFNNFGSILNCICLFFLCSSLAKDKKFDSILFIISTPLIIYFVSSNKLQLFFAILYFIIFLFMKSIKKFNNFNIFVLTLLIIFFVSGKISNILIALPITLFFFYRIYKQFFFRTFFFLFLNFLLVYFPILLKKFEIYGDPFSPFFEYLKNNPDQVVNQFAYNLRSSQGWLGLADFTIIIESILKIFFPSSISNLTNTLGLGMLLIFFIKFYKSEKEIYILSISNIMLILLTGQILPRYFIESFFLLSLNFYSLRFDVTKKFFYFIFKVKILLITILSTIYIIYCLYLLYPYTSKKNYLDKLAFTYSYASQVKKLNLKENVLSLDVSRKTIFFEINFFASSSLFLTNDRLKNLTNFIKIQNIKYLISKNIDIGVKNCLDLELITKFNYIEQAKRNFLAPSIESDTYVYKILGYKSNCEFIN